MIGQVLGSVSFALTAQAEEEGTAEKIWKVPKAWADYTLDEKVDAVYDYTLDSLHKLMQQVSMSV